MANHTPIRQALQDWLLDLPPDAPLPRMKQLAEQLPSHLDADAYAVAGALAVLARANVIAMRHGTRSEARGHYAIRIRATGRTHRTEGCPFDPPEG
jgi:hypothetical protein